MDHPFYPVTAGPFWEAPPGGEVEIHNQALECCCRALDRACSGQGSETVLLRGEAGIGKSHLAGRLHRHLRAQGRLHLLAIVDMNVHPRRLWRHLRRSLVDNWLKVSGGRRCQLETALLLRLQQVLRNVNARHPDRRAPALMDLLGQIASERSLAPGVAGALGHYLLGRHRSAALDWLQGTELSDEDLAALSLPAGANGEQDEERRSREVVLSFCRLAGPDLPLVTVFDRVESVQRYRDDAASAAACCQLVADLNDHTAHGLLMLCVQPHFFHYLKQLRVKAIADPGGLGDIIHRLLEKSVALKPIAPALAASLVAARFPGPPSLPADVSNRLAANCRRWLSENDAETITPRAALTECAARMSSPLPAGWTPSDSEFLTSELNRRLGKPEVRQPPGDVDALLHNALPLILSAMRPELSESDSPTPVLDVEMSSPRTCLGFCFANATPMDRLAERLTRLHDAAKRLSGITVFILRDIRRPVVETAHEIDGLLARLQRLGHRLVWLAPEAVAVLSVLRTLVADARAGDLLCDGKAVGEGTVRQWLKNHPPASMRRLAAALGDPESAPPPAPAHLALLQLLQARPVLLLKDATQRLDRSARNLLDALPTDEPIVGLLAGPPAVVFRGTPLVGLDLPCPPLPLAALWHSDTEADGPTDIAVPAADLLLPDTLADDAAAALLMRLFHHCVFRLVSESSPNGWPEAAARDANTASAWRVTVHRYLYDRVLGPQLTRYRVPLSTASPLIWHLWQSLEQVTEWLLYRLCPGGEPITAAKLPTIHRPLDAPQPDQRDFSRLTFAVDRRELPVLGPGPTVMRFGRDPALYGIAWRPVASDEACSRRHDAVARLMAPPHAAPVEVDIRWTVFGPKAAESLLGRRDSDPMQEKIHKQLAAPWARGNRSDDAENNVSRWCPDRRLADTGNAMIEGLTTVMRGEWGASDLSLSRPCVSPTALRFGVLNARSWPRVLPPPPADPIADTTGVPTTPVVVSRGGWTMIELPLVKAAPVDVDSVAAQSPETDAALGCSLVPAGIDLQGRLRWLDLNRPEQAHAVVAGSGALHWCHTAVDALTAANTPDTLRMILMADRPKLFRRYDRSPFLIGPDALVTPDKMSLASVLQRLVEEMGDRLRYMSDQEAADRNAYIQQTGTRLPRILFVCHRFDPLVASAPGDGTAIEPMLEHLGHQAGKTGIHLILTRPQRPHYPLADMADLALPTHLSLAPPGAYGGKPLLPRSQWPDRGGVLQSLDRAVWIEPIDGTSTTPAPDP